MTAIPLVGGFLLLVYIKQKKLPPIFFFAIEGSARESDGLK